MVILWDLNNDSKTNLIEHESDIVCLKFSEDGHYLFTIDGGLFPSICYWIISGPQLVQHVYLPTKTRKSPVRNCLLIENKVSNLLLVIENENEGYRASCWDLSKNSLNFMFATELESEAFCRSLFFTSETSSVFCTAESNVIKIWKVNSTNISQDKRIHLPQPIINASICSLSGVFAILTCAGSVILLSNEGKYISSLSAKSLKYTSLEMSRDTLYCGTENGNIELYNVGSLVYLGNIPYSTHIRESSIVQISKSQTGSSAVEVGPKVTHIYPNEKGEYVSIQYGDKSIAVFNIVKNSIISYQCGHFGKVSATKWLCTKLANSFVTCSHDMSLYFWTHSGDRWSFTCFDFPMIIDSSLRHYRFCRDDPAIPNLEISKRIKSPRNSRENTDILSPKSESSISPMKNMLKSLQLTAIAIHPKHSYVACGSSQGSIWFIDLSKGVLLNHSKPSILRIADMSFSPSGNFMAVTYCNGLVNLYDIRSNFEFLLQLEEPIKANAKTDKLSKLYHIGAVLSDDPQSMTLKNSADLLNLSKSGLYPATNAKGIQVAEPAFYALTSHNFSTVRVHKIYTKFGKFIKDVLVDLQLEEGKIAGFDIHPSKEYAILLSDAGYLYIFHIHLAQLRGKLKIPIGGWGCKVDPSGLYVAIGIPKNPDIDSEQEYRSSIFHTKYYKRLCERIKFNDGIWINGLNRRRAS